ncbi:MAG: hypothetical protein QME83_13675 [Thermodesulfobacteriota bacterium]|nr:hypothetical protein [Thermodesulfobacteriota bacterium]
MIDDEIEEKLRSLSPKELSELLGKLSGSDTLTNKQKHEFLELQAGLKEEAKQSDEAAKHLLKEKGRQMLDLIQESLGDDSLTTEQRQELVRTASMLAGYQMSFWLPTTMLRKVLMILFLAIGVIGAFRWNPWLGLFILLGCSFSPRIVGEVLSFVGKLGK